MPPEVGTFPGDPEPHQLAPADTEIMSRLRGIEEGSVRPLDSGTGVTHGERPCLLVGTAPSRSRPGRTRSRLLRAACPPSYRRLFPIVSA